MRRWFVAASTAAGVAAFSYSIWTLGLAHIREGVVRLGWGFGVVLVLSGLREVARATAWARTLRATDRVPLVEALRARKPQLAVTKVYDNPIGGHTFDRRVNRLTREPENNPEQVDSWKRIWHFLDRTLVNGESSPAVSASAAARPREQAARGLQH